MILKKPYAFLIKHFKLIHFIIAVLCALLAYFSSDIISFFEEYISNGYTASITRNMIGNIVNPSVFAFIILSMFGLLAIFILLKVKNKPSNFYLITIIYYIVFLLFVLIAYNLIAQLETDLWTSGEARAYRDISKIVYYPQFIFVIVLFARSFGFNVKQFNFKNDLREMEITEQDSEEVELNINFETYKAKRNVRRFFRELKYYYLENKFLLTIIAIVLAVFVGYKFIKNYEKAKYTYKESQIFTYNNFGIKINDSYITNIDYKGDKIYDDNTFLVINLDITNNASGERTFDYNGLKLFYKKNEFIYPSLDLGSYFKDLGVPYMGEYIDGRTTKNYIMAYKIDKSLVNKSFKISSYIGNVSSKNKFFAKTAVVKLSPSKMLNVGVVTSVALNDNIKLNNTTFKNSDITIKDFEFTDKYVYEYESCFKDTCNTFKDFVVSTAANRSKHKILVIDYDLNLDNTSAGYQSIKNANDFAGAFMKLEAEHEGQRITYELKNVTPNNQNKLVFDVDSSAFYDSNQKLLLIIRNKEYIINLSK